MFALLGLSACSSSDMDQVVTPENNENQEVVIPSGNDLFELSATTYSEMEEESRAGFTDAEKTITVWHKGDQVRLVSEAGASAVLTNEWEQGNTAFFRGTGEAAAQIDTYYAVYPATETISNQGVVTLNFTAQNGQEKSAIKAAGWCESVSKGEIKMAFKPINSLLYVTVSNLPAGYTIQKVKFTDLDNLLPAKQSYNLSTGAYALSSATEAYYEVTTSQSTFFISLPAGYTPLTGYALTVTASNGSETLSSVGGFGTNGGFKAGSTSRVNFDWNKNSIASIGPKTSYDHYLNNDSRMNAANSGQTVYCSADYASTYVMQNTLISKGFISAVGYTYDGTELSSGDGSVIWDTTNKRFYLDSDATGESKAAHSLTVWMRTKHGDQIVAHKTLHVTGIPYTSPDCRSTDITNAPGWQKTGDAQYWRDRGWQTSYYYNYLFGSKKKSGSLFSPTFYTPGSVNVTYTSYMAYFTAGAKGSSTATIYSGVTTGTTEAKTNSKNISLFYDIDRKPDADQYTACSHNATIPTGNTYRIYIADSRPEYKDNRAENTVCMRLFEIFYSK